MAETLVSYQATTRNLTTRASLPRKLRAANVFDKSTSARQDEGKENNQESDKGHDIETLQPFHVLNERKRSSESIEQLQLENAHLLQRLAQSDAEHAERIGILEAKLQQAIEEHKDVEQSLRSQLDVVRQEQQVAMENARKVRTILSRVSTWARQVQRSVHEHPSLHIVHPVDHDLDSRATPRTTSPDTLWIEEPSLAPNAQKCHESPSVCTKVRLPLDSSQCPVVDSCKASDVDINTDSFLLSPSECQAPINKRLNYAEFNVPSPSTSVDKTEIVLDDLLSSSHEDTSIRKRSAGSLLSYCAQVVTTSLAGVRSSPSPLGKITPVWKLDHSALAQEELQIDEEAGHCSFPPSTQTQHLNVALPSLSIGLL